MGSGMQVNRSAETNLHGLYMKHDFRWKSLPAFVAAAVPIYYSIYTLSKPIRTVSKFWYFFSFDSLPEHFWSPLFLLIFGMLVVISQKKQNMLSRNTLAIVGILVISSELRYASGTGRKEIALVLSLLYSLLLVSIILFKIIDSENKETLEFQSRSVFNRAAVAAFGLLASVVVVVICIALFADVVAFSPRGRDPAPAIMFLTGEAEVVAKTRIEFWAVAVAVVFLAVVTDTTRQREVRWLTALTLVVNVGAVTVFWYQTLWTATVAAVGALLTVITLALVLDERTEATLS